VQLGAPCWNASPHENRAPEADVGHVTEVAFDPTRLGKNGGKGDQTMAGYDVRSVVDDKHELIVASEVANRIDAGTPRDGRSGQGRAGVSSLA
jgi:hypothetical protein